MCFDRLAVELQSLPAVCQSFVVLLQLHVAQRSVGVVRRNGGTVALMENRHTEEAALIRLIPRFLRENHGSQEKCVYMKMSRGRKASTLPIAWPLLWLWCSRLRPPGICGSGTDGFPAPSTPEPTQRRPSLDFRTFCHPSRLHHQQLLLCFASLSWHWDPTGGRGNWRGKIQGVSQCKRMFGTFTWQELDPNEQHPVLTGRWDQTLLTQSGYYWLDATML